MVESHLQRNLPASYLFERMTLQIFHKEFTEVIFTF